MIGWLLSCSILYFYCYFYLLFYSFLIFFIFSSIINPIFIKFLLFIIFYYSSQLNLGPLYYPSFYLYPNKNSFFFNYDYGYYFILFYYFLVLGLLAYLFNLYAYCCYSYIFFYSIARISYIRLLRFLYSKIATIIRKVMYLKK